MAQQQVAIGPAAHRKDADGVTFSNISEISQRYQRSFGLHYNTPSPHRAPS